MKPVKLFLCGDVMTGRGIDQILAHPCPAEIHERWMRSALDYVRLAEEANGPIARKAGPAYVWGDAIEELDKANPVLRIINLETAVTASEDWVPKGINYRMSPGNIETLLAARVDCCVLANNHVLDWGAAGLNETVDTLHAAGIATAGAGPSLDAARVPAALPFGGGGRVLVFSVATASSGVPREWAAAEGVPGVDLVDDLSLHCVESIGRRIAAHRRPGDLVILSIHWGENWGYSVSTTEQRFAHALIDIAGADLVHGHSSHHPRPIEVHRGRAVLYGCGDLINDYEGISGHEAYRGDLGLMYFPVLDADSGRLLALDLVATTLKRFSLRRAVDADADWLAAMLRREGRRYGTSARRSAGCHLHLEWCEA